MDAPLGSFQVDLLDAMDAISWEGLDAYPC